MKQVHFLLLLLLAVACTKTTSYHGRVLNAANNQPVAGAQCYMTINGKYHNNETKGDFDTMVTDSTGTYQLEVEYNKSANTRFIRVTHKDFITALLHTEYGVSREQDIILYPYDAVLYVTFENTSATASRRYWYEIAGEPFILFQESGPTGYGPYTVPPNGKRTHVKRISGNTEMEVFWATHALTSPYNTEKVFCPRNDTTSITIPF